MNSGCNIRHWIEALHFSVCTDWFWRDDRRIPEAPHDQALFQKTTKRDFDEEFARFSNIVERESEESLRRHYNFSTYKDVDPRTEIPNSLLLGPWTADMTRYLFWLVRGGARIQWTDSTGGEVALVGLKNAIITGNLQVMLLLDVAGLHGTLIELDMFEFALRNSGGDKVAVFHRLLGTGISRNLFSPSPGTQVSVREIYKFHRGLTRIVKEAEAGARIDQEKIEILIEVRELVDLVVLKTQQ